MLQTLDPTLAAAAIGASLAVVFGVLVAAFSGGAARRYKRRLDWVRNRAKGAPRVEAVAVRSIAKRQSATPKIDRLARRWLPRREALAARLARTGRSITIGQYAIAILVLTLIAAASLILFTRIGVLPGLLFGAAIG